MTWQTAGSLALYIVDPHNHSILATYQDTYELIYNKNGDNVRFDLRILALHMSQPQLVCRAAGPGTHISSTSRIHVLGELLTRDICGI